jgi:uncharacterized membrane protein YdjX (TVP38/TMEM64 family)
VEVTTLDNPAAAAADIPPRTLLRVILLGCLLCAIVLSSIGLFGTETGRNLRDVQQLRATGAGARAWVVAHPAASPALFLAVYIACAILALPVWWLQILSGYAWGLAGGIAWSLIGHTFGSVLTMYVVRWLGGEWFHTRASRKMARFRRIAEGLGHNGLLVVLAARVCYVVPYGLSNYLFALTRIRGRDAALGTLLGGLPVVAGWVAIGARPAVLVDWRFWAVVIGTNVVLLAPLAIRYFARRRRGESRVNL